MITQGPEGPAPVGDIVATVYKDTGANVLYVEPLPPQSLPSCRRWARSATRWRGSGTAWPTSRPSSKPTPSGFTAAPTSTRNLGPRRGTLGDGDGEGS